jgi:CRISPR associated protein cas1
MTTLYLDRKNLSLRADSSALVCYENDKRVATVPLKILQRVCIRGDLTLSAKVLGKLGETGIGVLILSGRQKRPALMLPNWKLDGQRRMAQYALSQDKSASLTAARNTVAAKLSAQLQHLQQMAFSDGLNADCLKEHSQALSNLIGTLANISDIPGLRGIEGAAAARYFGAWAVILPQN